MNQRSSSEPSPHYLRQVIAASKPTVAKIAAQRLAALRSSRGAELNEGLLDFFGRASPQFDKPTHLQPIVDAFERTLTHPVRAVVSAPPQHGKTEVVKHGIAWLMGRRPRRNAYVSYGIERGRDVSAKIQNLAVDVGLGCEGNISHWSTTNGASLLATGIEGRLTGYGIDGVLVVDDPVKDRRDAESATLRDANYEWFHDVAMTRVHPGASVLVVQTRWHPDDLAGRLIADGWPFINLAAIAEEDEPTRKAGEPLWPARRPLDFLEKIRDANAYTWASLYQGRPRPKGGSVFGDPRFYDHLPHAGLRYSIGVDLAYTAKTSSDYSVAVVMAETGGTVYVVDVVREQVSQPTFARMLRGLCATYKGASVIGYVAGTERGATDFIVSSGVPLDAITAKGDKFVRAQPYAGAWNQNPGRVLLPRQADWLDEFIAEHARFTGLNDAHDDQVDAAAAAFDALNAPAAEVHVGGSRSFAGGDTGDSDGADVWTNSRGW